MGNKINMNQNPIIDKLISLLETKYVYESKVGGEVFQRPVLIVILKGSCSSMTQELSSMVAKIFQEETDFLYRIFSFEYAEKKLREGNLFFVHGCAWDKIIFYNPDDREDVFWRYCAGADTLAHITSAFQNELAKINSFIEGATFFLEKGNYSQSAFLLHQHLELWFRTVELFMMGKERKCHSIKEHQTYIKVFVPELGNLFNTEDQEELSLLRLLDEAYIATRYQNNYHINKVQIQKIQESAERMFTIVSQLFKDKLADYQKDIDSQGLDKKAPLNQGSTSSSEMPEPEVGLTLDEIKELAKAHFYTLKHYPNNKGLFHVNIRTEGYQELYFMISNLLKVCITALDADYVPNGFISQPEDNIREVLGYILELIPYEEMEFLDKIQDLLSDRKAQC
ncbi:MAG TPA: HEPN domain-containing protein [Arenibacter sp.]|nr:HEPN domain-containing protein [Arenibacter sp.]